jgi:hypothetical protein
LKVANRRVVYARFATSLPGRENGHTRASTSEGILVLETQLFHRIANGHTFGRVSSYTQTIHHYRAPMLVNGKMATLRGPDSRDGCRRQEWVPNPDTGRPSTCPRATLRRAMVVPPCFHNLRQAKGF